jgi:FkbM family methyltransferase
MAYRCQIPTINDLYEKYFSGKSDGVFVEVGAYDGFEWSNTWQLAELGWKGLYFEPIQDLADKCKFVHKNNNVMVDTRCVGSHDGKVKFHTDGYPTINQEAVDTGAWKVNYDPKNVIVKDLVCLNTALNEYSINVGFELLCIDVEGAELEVLEGIDLSFWRPRMMIIETCKNNETLSYRFHSMGIEKVVLSYGYTEVYFDHVNSVYIRD